MAENDGQSGVSNDTDTTETTTMNRTILTFALAIFSAFAMAVDRPGPKPGFLRGCGGFGKVDFHYGAGDSGFGADLRGPSC